MKIKGFIVALLTVFFFAGTALAGGPATMKTDVPTIPEADCDQAGWISLEVLNGFTLHEGDQIVWSTTNNVPLCKDIDIFLALSELGGGAGPDKIFPTDVQRAIFTSLGGEGIDVTGTDVVAGVLESAAAGSGANTWDFGFLIRGTSGSNRITLTVTRRFSLVVDNVYDATTNPTGNYEGQIGQGQWDDDADPTTPDVALGAGDYVMTVVAAPTSFLTIRLFDSNEDIFNDGGASQAGFYERMTTDPFGYDDDDIEPEDNVLCLDTNNDATLVNGQYVWATPDSQPGILPGASQVSFSGDYTIANISGSEGYATSTVGKGQCETVSIGATFDQFGNPIGDEATLDVGTYTGGLAGACTGSRWADQDGTCAEGDGYGVVITKSDNFAIADRFSMRLSLAVSSDGGNTYTDIGMDDAWFLTTGNVYETMASNIGNIQCDADGAVGSSINLGDNLTDTDTQNTDGANFILQSNYATVQGNTYDSFLLDVGQIAYLKSAFEAGDIIALKIELWKFPCGLVEVDYVCLATAVEDCGILDTTQDFLYFPYGVSANSAAFWTGIAITNVSANDGVATLTFWGVDGNVSTYEMDVAAYGISTIAVSAIFDDLEGDLTADENFQVTVQTDYAPADGICFVGGKGTNTVLHGYLPRLNLTD